MAPLDALAAVDTAEHLHETAADLNARYGARPAAAVVEIALRDLFPNRVALVSSFGAESAVLLHIAASVDRNVPVVFLDTGKLFPETLAYRTELAERLRLTDVRSIAPDAARLAELDRHGALWMTNPDMCCQIRKTEPLKRALSGFDAWFNGRKRFQNAVRSSLQVFEADGERIKINPLADWSSNDLRAYSERHRLPSHPLVSRGYPSIGCVPCTTKVAPGEDPRAGRWRGLEKAECGIHTVLEADGSGI
jgi:phosphoadenosine phosphosulfate reductase